MFVFIAPLVGTRFALECKHSDTIEYIKDKIADRTGLSQTRQGLLFLGRKLEEGRLRHQEGEHLVSRLVGGKPVIYLFSPIALPDFTVSVSLAPHWSFSHLYPVPAPSQPDGTLGENGSGLELSYLFWEAESTLSLPPTPPLSQVDVSTQQFDPAYPVLDHDTPTAVLLPFTELLLYFDGALRALSLHTSARNDFITYWLPKLAKKPFVALRFLPQSVYEHAASLEVVPKPDVVTRVFMLLSRITSKDALGRSWASARAQVGEMDWVRVVRVEDGAWDES